MSDATVVRPGDTLLVRVSEALPSEALPHVEEQLATELPGVRVVVVAGALGFAVYRPDVLAEAPAEPA